MKGIQILGPLPGDIQRVTVFSGGLHSGATETRMGLRRSSNSFTAPSAAPVIKKHGMEQADRAAAVLLMRMSASGT